MKRPPSQKSKKQQGVSPVSAPKVAVTLNKMVNGKYLYFDLSFYANHCQSRSKPDLNAKTTKVHA